MSVVVGRLPSPRPQGSLGQVAGSHHERAQGTLRMKVYSSGVASPPVLGMVARCPSSVRCARQFLGWSPVAQAAFAARPASSLGMVARPVLGMVARQFSWDARPASCFGMVARPVLGMVARQFFCRWVGRPGNSLSLLASPLRGTPPQATHGSTPSTTAQSQPIRRLAGVFHPR